MSNIDLFAQGTGTTVTCINATTAKAPEENLWTRNSWVLTAN
jgi:hypothetical protein